MSKFFWTLFKGPLIQRCSSSAVYTPKNIFFRPFFVFSLLLPFSMLKNAFKKYPPQNRTNVQIKGGGGSKAFWTMFKKTALFWNEGIPNPIQCSQNKFLLDESYNASLKESRQVLRTICQCLIAKATSHFPSLVVSRRFSSSSSSLSTATTRFSILPPAPS